MARYNHIGNGPVDTSLDERHTKLCEEAQQGSWGTTGFLGLRRITTSRPSEHAALACLHHRQFSSSFCFLLNPLPFSFGFFHDIVQ